MIWSVLDFVHELSVGTVCMLYTFLSKLQIYVVIDGNSGTHLSLGGREGYTVDNHLQLEQKQRLKYIPNPNIPYTVSDQILSLYNVLFNPDFVCVCVCSPLLVRTPI